MSGIRSLSLHAEAATSDIVNYLSLWPAACSEYRAGECSIAAKGPDGASDEYLRAID